MRYIDEYWSSYEVEQEVEYLKVIDELEKDLEKDDKDKDDDNA